MASAGEIPFRSELVGRAAEFGTLREHITAVRGGQGRVVFLAGEAGIGKSRLLEEVASHASSEGFRVMLGTCFHESLTPYSAFLEAFQAEGLDYLFLAEPLRIESLYVIDSAGLVLAKAERAESPLDPDIFTSMIRVVEEFLKDAVRQAGGEGEKGLNVLGLGDYRLYLQSGRHVTIVAVLTGRENEFLIEDLRDALARIEARFGGVLATWSGTLDEIEGMDAFLEPVLASKKYDGIDYARGDPKIRRNRLFENVSLGLARESRQAPIMLALDDLQWADPSTIALVHYIARSVRDARVLLVGAYRSEEIAMGLRGEKHPLEEALQLMSREGLHDEVRVSRLDEGQTTQLVESLLGAVDLAAEEEREVFRHSGGNPFFLIEIARMVVQEGLLVRHGDVWRFSKELRDVEIPTRVYHVVLRRLQRVAGEARDVLDVAAVLGDEFPSDALAACVGKERIPLLKLLRELEGTHRLVRSSQARYRFDHPQVREVLLREMPDGIRMEYHRIAAEALEGIHRGRLETNYRALSEIAYHYYEARDVERGVPYNLQAAAAAKQAYANEEGIRFDTQALELMQSGPGTADRVPVLETRAGLRELVGRFDEAIADYREALSLLPEASRDAARLRRKVGAIHQRRGQYDEAAKELEEGLALLGDAKVAEAGQIELWLGRTAAARADYDIATDHYRRANEALEAAPDRDELDLAEAQYSAGMVHYWIAMREPARMKEQIEAARAKFLSCLDTRKRRGDELGMRPALNMLANTYAASGKYEPAIEYYEQSLRIGERVGDLPGITKPLINLGRIHSLQGDRDAALSTFLRALGILLKVGDPHGLASVYRNAADVYLARAAWDQAIDYYSRCLEIAERIGDKVQRAGALQGLGFACADSGGLDKAAEWLGKALDAFAEVGAWEYACRTAGELVRVHASRNDAAAARAVCARAKDLGARAKTPHVKGVCLTMEAAALRASGEPDEAERLLAAARDALGDHASDVDLAGLEYEHGLLARDLNRREEASKRLSLAAEAARRAGRPGLAELAERALAA